jgi:hypothetical protein
MGEAAINLNIPTPYGSGRRHRIQRQLFQFRQISHTPKIKLQICSLITPSLSHSTPAARPIPPPTSTRAQRHASKLSEANSVFVPKSLIPRMRG